MSKIESGPTHSIILHYFRAALITIALAPPIGSYIFCLSAGTKVQTLWQVIALALFSIPASTIGWVIAYPLGAIPAFFSGIFYVAIIRIIFRGDQPNLIIRALIGAILGYGTTFIFQIIALPNNLDDSLSWIGACTGALITSVMRKLA